MTWTKSSDHYYDRTEIRDVDRSARLLHHEALVYCNKLLNDGRLPARDLGRVTDSTDVDSDTAQLVAVGLWTPIDVEIRPGMVLPGWQVDWTDQERAEDVLRRQAGAAERKRRKMLHDAGDHDLCNPKYCPVTRDGTRSSTRDGTANGTRSEQRAERAPVPPVPPGPPDPEGRSGEAGSTPRSKRRACPNGSPIGADGTCCGREHPAGTPPRLRTIPGGQA